jgi:hypothetical protein
MTTAHNAYYLFSLIPQPLKRVLKCRLPLQADEQGVDRKGLMVAIGPSTPVRWLFLWPEADGQIAVEVHELRKSGTKSLVSGVVDQDKLPAVLQNFGKQLGMQ